MLDIQNRSGVSNGGIRRYFKNTIPILNELALDILAEVTFKVNEIILNKNLSFKEQLELLIEIPYKLRNHFLLIEQANILSKKNELLKPFAKSLDNDKNNLFMFFKKRIEQEQVNNEYLRKFSSDDLSVLLFSCFEGIYICQLPSKAKFTKKTLSNNIDLLLGR